MNQTDLIPGLALGSPLRAVPFALSYLLIPIMIYTALNGGWWLLVPVLATFGAFAALDTLLGIDPVNSDTETDDDKLIWHRYVVLGWVPLALMLTAWMVWYVPQASHLAWYEKIIMFFNVGLANGAVGIVYAHELMHQKNKLERWAGDLLMALVGYGHFRTEHLLVHHRYIGTPRDGVTARYNENFHKFFLRVLVHGFSSAWRAEKQMLGRKNLPALHSSNPHWRYWGLQLGMMLIAVLLGGVVGVLLWLYQALVAIWYLELINYVEHYGLIRKHLGEGKYEHVLPRHSWNSAHMASNWLLINLQRHSDHHYKPDRRYPLLQTYREEEAPALPSGYPVIAAAALIPPLWFRMMNPRVQKWRKMYYPEINDWGPYKRGETPMPRGAS